MNICSTGFAGSTARFTRRPATARNASRKTTSRCWHQAGRMASAAGASGPISTVLTSGRHGAVVGLTRDSRSGRARNGAQSTRMIDMMTSKIPKNDRSCATCRDQGKPLVQRRDGMWDVQMPCRLCGLCGLRRSRRKHLSRVPRSTVVRAVRPGRSLREKRFARPAGCAICRL